MPDARIIIEGGIVAEPRPNETNGSRVTNLTVRAGRSRKNDQGGWDDLSSTAFDVACWNEVADALAAQYPAKGSRVVILGEVVGPRTYTDRDGVVQESVKVRADSVRVLPKRDQSQGGGYQQSQSTAPYGNTQASPPPQQDPWAGGGSQGGYSDSDVPF